MTTALHPRRATRRPVREHLAHAALGADLPQLRPEVARVAPLRARAALLVGAGVAGAGAAALLAPAPDTAMATGVVGAGLLTAVAANWSTCGMSVAGVVAAPKQPGRRGSSSPVRRLGWHALGSVLAGAPTGALVGFVGAVVGGALDVTWALGVWAVVALLYGAHEAGLITMPTPMRRRQLPRHLRRTMAPWKVSFVFGAMVGPGFLIFIRSSAYYLLVVGLALAGSPALGVALFVTVSLGRCLPALLAIVHTRRGGTIPGFLSAMCVVDRRVQIVTGAGMVALAAFGVGSLIR